MVYGSNESAERGKIDWIIAGMYLLFLLLGWLSVYAASYDLENAKSIFDLSGRAGMQLIWIGTSLVLAFALIKSDTGFFETYAFVFYAFGIFLLIVTLAIAPNEVVVYSRNHVTNKLLVEAGVKLHIMPSSELSRGRGGPRCMSMPLDRENL